jgi:hypothetical protein
MCYIPPELTGTTNGSLLFVVEESSKASMPTLHRSSDLGETWSPVSFPITKPDRHDLTFEYPRLLLVRQKLANYDLTGAVTHFVLATVGVRNEGSNGCPKDLPVGDGIHARSSTDFGATFSPILQMPIEGATPTKCVKATDLIQLHGAPFHGRVAMMSPAKFPPFARGELVLSTDALALPLSNVRLEVNGRSNIFNATAVPLPFYPPNPTGRDHPPWGFDEAAFTELSNGSLFAIFRTGCAAIPGIPAGQRNGADCNTSRVGDKKGSKRFYYSYSHDAGESWDVARPHPDLPTPVCLPTVTTTGDGSLLVSGPASTPSRTNLTVWKSTDNGQSFRARKLRPGHELVRRFDC